VEKEEQVRWRDHWTCLDVSILLGDLYRPWKIENEIYIVAPIEV
jgi:hypothetical protein